MTLQRSLLRIHSLRTRPYAGAFFCRDYTGPALTNPANGTAYAQVLVFAADRATVMGNPMGTLMLHC